MAKAKRQRDSLLDVHGELDVHRLRGQALFLVTGLKTQLAIHQSHARLGRGRSFKFGHDLEPAAEHRYRLLRERIVLQQRFRIDDLLGFQRPFDPRQFERDQIFVGGLVAVDVVTCAQFGGNGLSELLSSFGMDAGWRGNVEYAVILGRRGRQRQRQGEARANQRAARRARN